MLRYHILVPILLLCVHSPRLRARSLTLRSDDLDSNGNDNDDNSNGGDRTRKHEAWVRISEPPDAQLERGVGARFELTCEAVGSPPPTIEWLRDGQTLANDVDEAIYEMNRVVADGGARDSHALSKQRARLIAYAPHHSSGHVTTYTCVATNGVHVAVATTQLHVTPFANRSLARLMTHGRFVEGSTAAARIVLYDTIYMDNIGEDVILPCAAVGSPAPDVFWLDPSEQAIEEDARHQMLPNGALRISDIRWKDMGPYTCVARNAHGQDNVTTFLYPMLAEK